MTRILSFSAENSFASDLERLMGDAGYKNRSMFLRDASIHYAESKRRGDLEMMDSGLNIEGTLVIYYQHESENKLIKLRHSPELEVHSYHHNCLQESHTCVDTMQIKVQVGPLRTIVTNLNQTKGVDRVGFTLAPDRTEGCC